MQCTRRHLDRRSSVLLVVLVSAMMAGGASCASTDDDTHVLDSPDAMADANEEAQAPDDAGVDATHPRDAALVDAAPRPVVCASPPCATALVTTLRGAYFPEGYCALLDDGTVACWGANADGQLGRGDDAGSADSAIAARVLGLSNVVKLDHTCAIDANGSVWCWGTGPFLRDGTGDTTTERTPVKLPIPPAKNVGIGNAVGCAADDEGLLCWGQNTLGQVASPPSGALSPALVPLPAGAAIRQLAIGDATFAVREDDVALSWGANPPLARVSSLRPDPHPGQIALDVVSSIDIASTSGCAVSRGTGWCWGPIETPSAPLEGPSPLAHALPEPVVTPEPIVRIATTVTSYLVSSGSFIVQPPRWCAVGISGDVYCWGLNTSGQAGDGTQNHAFEAVKVQGLPAPAVEVKTMPMSTCALLETGKVYCWGNNFFGQLGIGTLKGVSLMPKEVVLP